jgi:hypothetical protein
MKEMQRYEYCSTCICPLPKADGRCLLVLGMALLADAEAAISIADQRGREQQHDDVRDEDIPRVQAAIYTGNRLESVCIGGIEFIPASDSTGYISGQRAMLAKCIAEVDACFIDDDAAWNQPLVQAWNMLRFLQEAMTDNAKEKKMPEINNITVPVSIEMRVCLTADDGTVTHVLDEDLRTAIETLARAALDKARREGNVK